MHTVLVERNDRTIEPIKSFSIFHCAVWRTAIFCSRDTEWRKFHHENSKKKIPNKIDTFSKNKELQNSIQFNSVLWRKSRFLVNTFGAIYWAFFCVLIHSGAWIAIEYLLARLDLIDLIQNNSAGWKWILRTWWHDKTNIGNSIKCCRSTHERENGYRLDLKIKWQTLLWKCVNR